MDKEKLIFSMIFHYPHLFPVLRANYSEDLFTRKRYHTLFQKMKELYEKEGRIDLIQLYDQSKTFISGSELAEFITSDWVKGIPLGWQEKELLRLIEEIKKEKAHRMLISEISEIARGKPIDWEAISAIVEKAKVTERERESGDFEIAFEKFVEWITLGSGAGITIGFPSLDHWVHSYNYGELLSILGRPTAGKTFFALHITQHLVNTMDIPIGFFSLEMTKEALVMRMVQSWYGMSFQEVRSRMIKGELVTEDFVNHHAGNLKIYEKPYSVDDINQIVKEDDLRIILIDYLNIIKTDQPGSLYEKTTRKMLDLKNLAKEREIFLILLVQLSRAVAEYEAVRLDSARDSGAIEENSDFMIGISNPYEHPSHPGEWEGFRYVRLIKNKRGRTGGIKVRFDSETGKMMEVEESDGSIPENQPKKPAGLNWG